jgi:hypothetical protein
MDGRDICRCRCFNIRRESTDRQAMATSWHTFHHDGKFSPAWRRGGAHTPPFTISTITSKFSKPADLGVGGK